MLIKRIKELLFSGHEDKIYVSHANFFIDELIKILEMGDRCKQDVPHWINQIIGAINKSKSKIDNLNTTSLFLGVEDKISVTKINQLKRSELNSISSLDYIKWRYSEVFNQSKGGNPKYQHLLKSNLSKEGLEELYYKLKYIGLCVSGQFDPDVDVFYESFDAIKKTNINFTSIQNKYDLRTLLNKIIHEQFYL